MIDLFAGAGGWDLGARVARVEGPVIGIELDQAACATRAAAGLLTIRADVASYPTEPFRHKTAGIIASPPCQAFSKAGKQLGLADVRGQLVFQVLRWVGDLRPSWVACEQVEDVAPIWRLFRGQLRAWGYSAWCGVLDAADYGVPQNRHRAILMASLDRPVQPPTPTHARDPQPRLDGPTLEPWVSMAEALGWGMTERPAMTVAVGQWKLRTGANTMSKSRRPADVEQYERGVDRPAPTVDTKAATAWKLRRPGRSYGTTTTTTTEKPAPCIALGHNLAEWCWEAPATTVCATAARGHHDSQWNDAVRVELHELAVLQGFPADYPFRGNQGQRAQQIGNAIPPGLAAAVLSMLSEGPHSRADTSRRAAALEPDTLGPDGG